MEKIHIDHLTFQDVSQILYISKQGNGRVNLILNLFNLKPSELSAILDNNFILGCCIY
jgi:hypothetical protein